MKNNLTRYLLAILILFFFQNDVFADEFNFDVSEINISDNGNVIKANQGVATAKGNDIIIEAEKFEYNRVSSVLLAINGNVLLKQNNIKIKGDRVIYDKNNSQINASGNVIISDLTQNVVIKTNDVIYNEIDQKITSGTATTINDDLGNIITSSDFIYTLNDNLIKLNNVKIIGSENDIIQIKKAYLNLLTKKTIGKNISIDFNNNNFGTENEPRLKGNAVSIDQNISTISKGIFTTCKKNDDCPPWEFLAKEIKHDKKKKLFIIKMLG